MRMTRATVERTASRSDYFRLFDTLVKVADRLVPTVVMAVMMTSAIRAAIRPYSIAVAPDSSRNFWKIITGPVLKSRAS